MDIEALTAEEERLLAIFRITIEPIEQETEELRRLGLYDGFRRVHRHFADLVSSSRLVHWRYPKLVQSSKSLEPLKRALFIQWYAKSDPRASGETWAVDKQPELLVLAVANCLAASHTLDEDLHWMIPYYCQVTPYYFVCSGNFKALLNFCRQHQQIPWAEISSNRTRFKNRGHMGEYWLKVSASNAGGITSG